ncbi:MAG TPA: malate/lactate/ureidoglycolate dehydrogenase [Casimicrobiaceae bacterium]|nr:malate/lactate/ureidoglycolate dehydrogenase [Casimicrobiaceae bacterium]
MSDASQYRIPAAELRELVASVFRAARSSDAEAHIVSDHLVDADLAGHDSHGVVRVAKYVEWHANGMVLDNRHSAVVRETPVHAVVDGQFGYGQVIAREAMDLAIAKTRRSGVCVIAIRNAGHLGRIGAWAEQVAHAGFASIHFVNTSGFGLLVAPFGGTDRRLSANPIAAGAPGPGGVPLILDISTSAIAEGKIQVARNRGEPLPEGCTIDAAGQPNRDPARFYGPPAGALLPVGGHKGYGLSIFCEVLAGALSGGQTTHPGNATAGRLGNNMTSVLFDPAAFSGEESFSAEIARMAAWVKASPPAAAGGEVLLPGDIERRTRAQLEVAGIALDTVTRRQIADTARTLAVTLPPGFAS